MSGMIERVARALHGQMAPEVPWAALRPDSQAIACEVARAALEAMREPTEAMILDGQECLIARGTSRLGVAGVDAIVNWRAMIDAALKE